MDETQARLVADEEPMRSWYRICSPKSCMKTASFRAHPDKGGWIRTTIAPINHKHEATCGVLDILMLMALVLGTGLVARLLLAH
jgi:hypothetical protein